MLQNDIKTSKKNTDRYDFTWSTLLLYARMKSIVYWNRVSWLTNLIANKISFHMIR